MKPKQPSIRVFGQRSLDLSLFRSSNPFSEPKPKESKRDSSVSLSDFLDQKLNKSCVLPKPVSVQEKSQPFKFFARPRDVSGSTDVQIGIKKGREEDKIRTIDKTIFEQFKPINIEKVDNSSASNGNEDQIRTMDEVQESRKRKNPFVGLNEKEAIRKPVIVLGDRPSPKQQRREVSRGSNKMRRPIYNHYANGRGWWDCDMEGVDSGELDRLGLIKFL